MIRRTDGAPESLRAAVRREGVIVFEQSNSLLSGCTPMRPGPLWPCWSERPGHPRRSSVDTGVTVPSVGQSWVADFGDETPFGGPFGAKITYTSSTELTITVTKGSLKGSTDTVTYTTTRLRPGQYMLRRHELKSGAYVTHVEDFAHHTVSSSIVFGDQFMELEGSFTQAG